MLKCFLNLFFFSLTVQVLAGPGCSCLKGKNIVVNDSAIQKDEQRSSSAMDRATIAYASSASVHSSELSPVAPRNSPALAPINELQESVSLSGSNNDCYSVLANLGSKTATDRTVTPQSSVISSIRTVDLNTVSDCFRASEKIFSSLNKPMPPLRLDPLNDSPKR